MRVSVKWLFPLALAALVLIPVAAQGQFAFDENPLVGKQALDFTLKTLSGQTMSLNQYRQGSPAIIFFWATWCPHCRDELKVLSRQSEDLQRRGIKILLVDIEESPRQIHALIDKYHFPFEVFLDEQSAISDQYSIVGVPTLFFINKDGVVTSMEHELPENYAELLKADFKKRS